MLLVHAWPGVASEWGARARSRVVSGQYQPEGGHGRSLADRTSPTEGHAHVRLVMLMVQCNYVVDKRLLRNYPVFSYRGRK